MSITYDPDIEIKKVEHLTKVFNLLDRAMRPEEHAKRVERYNRHFKIEPAHLDEQAGDNPEFTTQQMEDRPDES